MAITLAQLRANVRTLLIDPSPQVAALIDTWINRAVTKLQQKHNFKAMQAEVVLTTTQSTRILGPRPSDWKEANGLPYILGDLDGYAEMTWVSALANAQAMWGDNPDFDYGAPQGLFDDDENNQFLVFPYPDGLSSSNTGEYSVHIPYWRYLPQMTGDIAQNWFTNNASSWIEYQAVSEGFYANQDYNSATIWEKRAAGEYSDVILADKRRWVAETNVLVPYRGARRPHVGR